LTFFILLSSQANKLLEHLPLGTSRGTVTMLCNLATAKGQEAAARVFFRQTASTE